MATTYGNLNKVKKLTNSSLTSILDVTNLNFTNLAEAVKIFLDAIEYDEAGNAVYVSAITNDALVVNQSITVKNNGVPKVTIDNEGRIEGATMLFSVTETQRQRFVSYPDYPETGVDGEIIFTGLDLIAWFDERGWVSLTTGNEGGGGGIVTSITTTSPYVTITPPSGIGEVTIDVEGGFGTLIGGATQLGRIPKWVDSLELHDSNILDDGDSVTIEKDVYLPDIPVDGTNSLTNFVVISPGSGVLKYTSEIVRTVDGNIVDNTDPTNPIIDQVQADWGQTDTNEVSYINNKPNIVWELGDGVDSIVAVQQDDAFPIANGKKSLAYGDSTIASSHSSTAAGNFSVTGEKLKISKNEFEVVYSDCIRVRNYESYFFGVDMNSITSIYCVVPTTTGASDYFEEDYLIESIDTWIKVDVVEIYKLDYDVIIRLAVPATINSLFDVTQIFPKYEIPGESSAFASGTNTSAIREGSTSTGGITKAAGKFSSASGYLSEAHGNSSSAEGNNNRAFGENSKVIGSNNISAYENSFVGGTSNIAGASLTDLFTVNRSIFKAESDITSQLKIGETFRSYARFSETGGMSRIQSNGKIIDLILTGESPSTGSTVNTFSSMSSGSDKNKVIMLKGGNHIAIAGSMVDYGGTAVYGLVIVDLDGNLVAAPYFSHITIGPPLIAEIVDIVEDRDGSIIVVGSFNRIDDNSTVCGGIAKLNYDYSFDFSFANNIGVGFTTFGNPYSTSNLTDVSLFSDNSMIVVGAFNSFKGVANVKGIAKLYSDGTLAPFSIFVNPTFISKLLVQKKQDILYVGLQQDTNFYSDYALTIIYESAKGVAAFDSTGSWINSFISFAGYVNDLIFTYDDAYLLIAGGGGLAASDGSDTRYGSLIMATPTLQLGATPWITGLSPGTGYSGNAISLSRKTDGGFIVSFEALAYVDALSIKNLSLIAENGEFNVNLGQLEVYGPSSTVQLTDGSIVVIGKFTTIDGLGSYSGIAHFPSPSITPITLIVLNSEEQYPILNGKDIAIIPDTNNHANSFIYGRDCASFEDDSHVIGRNSISLYKDSISLGKDVINHISGSLAFSSGKSEYTGDSQTFTLTGTYLGPIGTAGEKHHLLEILFPALSTTLTHMGVGYRAWSIQASSIGVILDEGSSGAAQGDFFSQVFHGSVLHNAQANTYALDSNTLSSLGNLDSSLGSNGTVSLFRSGDTIVIAYLNSGFTGPGGDGLVKISVSVTITETVTFT